MKHLNIFIAFILLSFLFSCNKEKKEIINSSFGKSYKEKKANKLLKDYYDSVSHIYSNYEYKIAIYCPKKWEVDEGLSKYSIFRTYQKDSSITFSVSVTEADEGMKKLYDEKDFPTNESAMKKSLKKVYDEKFNTQVEMDYVKLSFLKNYRSINMKCNFSIRDGEYSYPMINLTNGVIRNNLLYNFYLTMPKIFYEKNKPYYDDILTNIAWL
jgi:hypothetical protein